jgi:hypothetical protein
MGNATLLLPSGFNYTLGGTHLDIPAGVAVTIATLGQGPRAVIDGERQSRLFFVSGGDLRLINVELARGERSTTGSSARGGAIYASYGASVHVSGSVITERTALAGGSSYSEFLVRATPGLHTRSTNFGMKAGLQSTCSRATRTYTNR